MIGRDHPNHGGPPDLPRLGRVALWMITRIVPKAYRDEFVGDLLEEYESILREKGRAEARRWFWGQVLRSIPPLLLWQFEPGIRLLRPREFLTRVVEIALFAYLLPAVLMGAMLYGVVSVICFLVDATRRVNSQDLPDFKGLGWVALWMITRVVPKAYRDEFVGDLLEEYESILREKGRAEARRWFWGQVLRSIPPLLLWRFEPGIRLLRPREFLTRVVEIALVVVQLSMLGIVICFLRSAEFLPRVILIILCVYLLPAVLVVVLLSWLGIVICILVDASGRFPPTMRRGGESIIRKVVDVLKKLFHRGGDRYRAWRPERRPEGAGMWPRFVKLFTWIILG